MSDSNLSSLIEAAISWADFGSKLVIIGIFLETIDLIIKCEENEGFCTWFGDRFEELNLTRLRKFSAFLRPKVLPIEFISFWLVVIGLTIEMNESGEAYRLSARQNAILNREAGDAWKLAQAIGTTNAQLVADNLVLRSKLLVLELKLQPRTITADQVRKFIFLTEKISKIPIKICVGLNSDISYAGQVRSMFSSAKFGIDSSANTTIGLTGDLLTAVARPLGDSLEWPSVIFITYGTNNTAQGVYNFAYYGEDVKGFSRPITHNKNDVNEIFADLKAVFQQIDISFFASEDLKWVKPGESALLITPRDQ